MRRLKIPTKASPECFFHLFRAWEPQRAQNTREDTCPLVLPSSRRAAEGRPPHSFFFFFNCILTSFAQISTKTIASDFQKGKKGTPHQGKKARRKSPPENARPTTPQRPCRPAGLVSPVSPRGSCVASGAPGTPKASQIPTMAFRGTTRAYGTWGDAAASAVHPTVHRNVHRNVHLGWTLRWTLGWTLGWTVGK